MYFKILLLSNNKRMLNDLLNKRISNKFINEFVGKHKQKNHISVRDRLLRIINKYKRIETKYIHE